jgi:hypothetical protein
MAKNTLPTVATPNEQPICKVEFTTPEAAPA